MCSVVQYFLCAVLCCISYVEICAVFLMWRFMLSFLCGDLCCLSYVQCCAVFLMCSVVLYFLSAVLLCCLSYVQCCAVFLMCSVVLYFLSAVLCCLSYVQCCAVFLMFSVVLCFAAAHLPPVAGHLTVFSLQPTFCRAFTVPGARGSYTCSSYWTEAVLGTQTEAVLET